MRFLLLAVFSIAVVLATPAMGQMVCKERSLLVERLHKKYKEFKKADGLTMGGQLVEVFVSEGGSWTILISDPTGTSCVAAAGQTWRSGLFADGVFTPKT